MHVNPRDGWCHSCGGTLRIIDADDVTLTVECTECGDTYSVEIDAFGDGGMTYYPDFVAERMADDEQAQPPSAA